MSLSISIPDEFAEVLGATAEERERRTREALALELYREGKISLRRMGELAGVGGEYWAAENFRIRHKAPLNYSVEDLEADRQAADGFLHPWSSSSPTPGQSTIWCRSAASMCWGGSRKRRCCR